MRTKKISRTRGATLVEYALLLVAITIAAGGAYKTLGKAIRARVSVAAAQLGANTGGASEALSTGAPGAAEPEVEDEPVAIEGSGGQQASGDEFF